MLLAFSDKEKNELSGHMGRNCPPALFITADGFEGNSQKIGNCSLGFIQPFSYCNEFFAVHGL